MLYCDQVQSIFFVLAGKFIAAVVVLLSLLLYSRESMQEKVAARSVWRIGMENQWWVSGCVSPRYTYPFTAGGAVDILQCALQVKSRSLGITSYERETLYFLYSVLLLCV